MGNGNIKKTEDIANVSEKVLEKLKQKLGNKEAKKIQEEKPKEKTNSANKEEKTLEEEIEEEKFEEFERRPNFFPGIVEQERREAPLEQVARTAPPVESEEKKEDNVKYGVVSAAYAQTGEYISSKYAAYEAAPTIREMERRGFMIQQHEVGQVRPRAEVRRWHELQETPNKMDDAVMEVTPLDKETRMPFEEKRKYRNKPVF